MKNLLVACTIYLLFSLPFAEAQTQTTQGRENWFPNRGNVGIGTRTPSENLEVIGNMKVTNTTFTEMLRASSTESGSLLILNNSIINGRLGIGVPNPTEKLDVLGNFRLQGHLTAQGLNIQSLQASSGIFNTLTINQNSTFSGIASFGENVSFFKNAFVGGKLGIGISSPSEALDVSGNIRTSGNLFSSTLSTGSGQFTSLTVSENTTLNGAVNFSNKITSQNDVVVNGNVGIGFGNPTEKLEVNGNVKSTGSFIGDAATFNTGKINQHLDVAGNLLLGGNLQMKGILNVSSLNVTDISTTSSAAIGQDLSVTGKSDLAGDLNVTGKINAGIIEATEFRSANGTSPFNFDNAVISQSLIIGSNRSIPANYKLAVGGNVIATGIDIKIPQKWPDYVFTQEYGLISLTELEAFIKQHGHLPAIPSAAEMEAKENYNVAEMDAKLLEKIEELTLYIIDLKKKLDQQKAESKKGNK